jgi:hypothetical protein
MLPALIREGGAWKRGTGEGRGLGLGRERELGEGRGGGAWGRREYVARYGYVLLLTCASELCGAIEGKEYNDPSANVGTEEQA